ncbi:hypothetical protein [Salmonella phage NINP13076]|nr:hypothetical protein [Salmonella phage NINP13076]
MVLLIGLTQMRHAPKVWIAGEKHTGALFLVLPHSGRWVRMMQEKLYGIVLIWLVSLLMLTVSITNVLRR